MARTGGGGGGNLSELKPVKTCVDFIRRIPVSSTPPILLCKSILKHNGNSFFVSFYVILADNYLPIINYITLFN